MHKKVWHVLLLAAFCLLLIMPASLADTRQGTIILEGMGPQFDPSLRETYEHARPKLEEYYTRERERA